jgi:hypothetical protein
VRRDFRKLPNFSVRQLVKVNDERVYSVSDIAQATAKWTAFTKFHETQNLFMLLMGASRFRLIPKRALSAAQIDELRQLLHHNLPIDENDSESRSPTRWGAEKAQACASARTFLGPASHFAPNRR